MDVRPITDRALTPLSEKGWHAARIWRRFTLEPTLTRPITDFDDWYDMEQLGTDPNPWSPRQAMETLRYTEMEWPASRFPKSHGYSEARRLGVNPHSYSPVAVLAHEMSHIALGHTYARCELTDDEAEVEAELSTFVILAYINAVTERSVAVSKAYLHTHLNKLDKPVSDETITKVGRNALSILRAGGWS